MYCPEKVHASSKMFMETRSYENHPTNFHMHRNCVRKQYISLIMLITYFKLFTYVNNRPLFQSAKQKRRTPVEY